MRGPEGCSTWRRRVGGRPLRSRSSGFRAPNAEINVGSLSGGNQQKVLLSRLLESNPRVLILDEPTRGVDVGAKSEIYRIIDELARDGCRDRRHFQRVAGGGRACRIVWS